MTETPCAGTCHCHGEPLALDARAAAARLAISTRTLARLVVAGRIPVVRIGRRMVFRVASLDSFLKNAEGAAR